MPPWVRRVLSCGGGGSGASLSPGIGGGAPPTTPTTPTADNVVSVVVDAGPSNANVNTLFTSVTVCVPGSTTNCQTIDHIQVDTASFGLRILSAALTLSLPVQPAQNGNALLECTAFVDGYSWGPVALVDLQIGGETAASLPIQIIGDPRFTSVPAACSGSGTEEDTVGDFGANGILGIGVFAQDCGSGCVNQADNMLYYSCTSAACQQTTVSLVDQVPNPITFFAKDSNGSIIELPTVAASGAPTLTGTLTFGVDTQSNNQSGTETVLTVDPSQGYFTTLFGTQSLAQSFIDTGSNGLFFTDTSLTQCPAPNPPGSGTSMSGFYCPAASQDFTATLTGQNGMTATVSFTVANAQTQANANPTFTVFPELAGTFPTADAFDWGLPFYYGRRVATVVENATTSLGTGPYIAF